MKQLDGGCTAVMREAWNEVEVEVEARTGRSEVRPDTAAVFTLMLEGELGAKELAHVGEELFRLMHQAQKNVVIDFTEVSHLDYRGVKPLVSRAELFRRAGGDIKLAGLSPYLEAILRASGAHETFELYPSFHDAKAAFVRTPRHLA